jgi:hypothetical protein
MAHMQDLGYALTHSHSSWIASISEFETNDS